MNNKCESKLVYSILVVSMWYKYLFLFYCFNFIFVYLWLIINEFFYEFYFEVIIYNIIGIVVFKYVYIRILLVVFV